jgi:hypothetical protein
MPSFQLLSEQNTTRAGFPQIGGENLLQIASDFGGLSVRSVPCLGVKKGAWKLVGKRITAPFLGEFAHFSVCLKRNDRVIP